MLWKAPQLEIDPEDPFKHDRLGRKDYVENMASLVESSSESLVLAIDGPWGAGKTTFLMMAQTYLKNRGHHTLSFNAWECDFAGDPMLPLVGELTESLSPDASYSKEALQKVKLYGAALVRSSIPILIRAGSAGLIDGREMGHVLQSVTEGMGEKAAQQAEDHIAAYQATRSSFHAFRSNLAQVAEQLHADNASRKVVFFIDELDRCRPDFGLALIERVKHLFTVPGVTFILGLNQTQLANSVRATYGRDIDARGYLRRLIDLRFSLPPADAEAFVEHLFHAAGLEDVCENRGRGHEDLIAMKQVMTALSDMPTFTARLQQRCIGEAGLVLRTTPPTAEVYPSGMMVLIALRALERELYDAFRQGEASAEEVLKILYPFREDYRKEVWMPGAVVRGYLWAFSRRQGEIQARADELKERVKHENENQNHWGESEPERELERLQHMSRREGECQLLISRIELARRFS